MAGIVIFGGTTEGRKLAEAFQDTPLQIQVCVATQYGASLLPHCPNIKIQVGRMEEAAMEAYLREWEAEYCFDATHPYATCVTENIRTACKRIGLPYFRVLRQTEEIDSKGVGEAQVYVKPDIEEAVAFLNQTQGVILITTGSKDLKQYTAIREYQKRCFVRILPDLSALTQCQEMGFAKSHLIGMQGPFTEAFNEALLKQIGAKWMVTKNAGKEGGYQDKCEAALHAGANLVVIAGAPQPSQTDSLSLTEAIAWLTQRSLPQHCLPSKRQVSLIGMGPGSPALLTQEAQEELAKCDVLIGAKRVLLTALQGKDKPFYDCYQKEEILLFLQKHTEYRRAALVYSGDIGFFSGACGMAERLADYEVKVFSGISTPTYLLNKLHIPLDTVKSVSCHAKQIPLLSYIKHHQKVCTLLGEGISVSEIAQKLRWYHMEDVKITVGERLSYPEERIVTGYPEELGNLTFEKLSVALFENPRAIGNILGFGIADSRFIRGSVPMTKQDIRTLALSRLRLQQDSILYDIGAGTGSVAVEAALQCEEGQIYAIEKNPEAILLIKENKQHFQADNLEVVVGEAPDCILSLPIPTHVFIGGSGGRLQDIIRSVHDKNTQVRFVLTVVTLETWGQLEQIKAEFPEYIDMEVIQVNIARSRPLGRYHSMGADNPVSIICFGGRKEQIDG
ncbi:MAG: precorrin-6A reductase [Lachnospiraceae bacterium]